MKRTISLILALILVISTGSVFAEIGDYEKSWAKEEITYMLNKGVISGYPDKTFKPANNMTRAEFYRLINTLLGYSELGEVEYEDVKAEDWFYEEVQKASKANYLVKGKKLNPNGKITRGEVAKIIGNRFEIEEDIKEANNFLDSEEIPKEIKGIIGGLKKKGYIAGYPDKTFRYKSEITRAEVVKMLHSISGKIVNEASQVKEDIKTNLLLTSKDVSLENMTIEGNLYLTEGVGEGDISLDNVNIKGEMFIKGGGSNSVIIKNSKINKLSIDKQERPVRVVFENSNINKIKTKNQSKVELKKNAKVSEMILSGKTDLSLEKGTSVAILNSHSKDINIESQGTIELIKTKEDIKINEEIVKANTEIKIEEGKVIKSKTEDGVKVNTGQSTSSNKSWRGNSSSGGSSSASKPEEAESSKPIPPVAKLEVKSVEVLNDTKLKVTLSDNTNHEIILKEALEANVEKEVSFKINGIEYKTKLVWEVKLEIPTNKLDISADSIISERETDLTFHYKYEGKLDPEFYLLESRDDGKWTPYIIDERKVRLKDDGDLNNGDLIESDGIYSAKEKIIENKEGYLKFAIGIKDGNEWKLISSEEKILVINPLTEADIEAVNKTSTQIKNQIETLKSKGKKQKEIKNLVKNELKKNNDEIEKVEESESGNGIWYTFKSGVLGAVTLEVESEEASNSNNFISQSLFNIQKENIELKVNENQSLSVGNPRVGIFTFSEELNKQLIEKFTKSVDNTFMVRSFIENKASVEEFKKLSDYGTIIFDTKGESLFKGNLKENLPNLDEIFTKDDEKIVILTGEKVSDEKIELYNADLKTGRLVIVDDYFAITPAFINHYNKGQENSLPKSLVYANTSRSAYNEEMAKAFIENGAQTYIGYEEARENGELVDTIEKMLDKKAVKDSIGKAKVFGNMELVLLIEEIEENIINPSLEEGLKGWVGKGHIDTISRLGSGDHKSWHTIRPTKDNNMGIISSGVDKGALYGRQSWIYQTITIPKEMTNLKFDYNVASSEPMRFIGSRYDDKFKATIVEGSVKEPSEDIGYEDDYGYILEASNYSSLGENLLPERLDDEIATFKMGSNNSWVENTVDENEVIIGFESINSSDWGQNFFDDQQRVDVVFPHGDETTYMTGWKTVNYDVSKYQGKTITLKLQVWDLGDTAYPTAVLFDNVRLTKSSYDQIGIEGRNEVRIPNKGLSEYLYEVGRIDQDGDIETGKIITYEDEDGYVKPERQVKGNVRMAEEVKGIELNEETGILSVYDHAEVGEITLIASDNDGREKEMIVKIKEAQGLIPSFIEINGKHNIKLGQEDSYSEKYEGLVLDQDYNLIDKNFDLEWSLMETIDGISINTSGELLIDPSLLKEDFVSIEIRAYAKDFDIVDHIYVSIEKLYEAEININIKEAIDKMEEQLPIEDQRKRDLYNKYRSIANDQLNELDSDVKKHLQERFDSLENKARLDKAKLDLEAGGFFKTAENINGVESYDIAKRTIVVNSLEDIKKLNLESIILDSDDNVNLKDKLRKFTYKIKDVDVTSIEELISAIGEDEITEDGVKFDLRVIIGDAKITETITIKLAKKV